MNKNRENEMPNSEKGKNESNINNEDMKIIKDENDINLANNINNNNLGNNNQNNENFSKTSFKLSLSYQSQVEVPISNFNPSQFSFKQKSNSSFSSINNNINNSFEKFITPQKDTNKNDFEKLITVEKLRRALAPQNSLDLKNKEIPHFHTEVKHFPKYPEFKKVTFDDLPDLEIMILDDVDKNAFNIYEKVNFPPIEEIAEIMKNKNINEEDFDYYSSVSYLLFIKRNIFSSIQRQLFLKNIPFHILNDFFANYQSKSINNDSSSLFYFSSSQSPTISFPTKNINTLSMVLNIIIFCIQTDEDMKMFIENFGKDEVYFFIDNLCYLLQSNENFRLQRKILGLLTTFFIYNDEIILNYFRKVERIIDNLNISTNMIIKLQQILKNKQKKYINLIVENKNEIEEKIQNNDIDNICYIIRFLIFILSGTQGNFIFDEKEYVAILKFFKELNIRNQKLNELIYQLKIRIKRLV
jgi:hypothetical protein